MGHLFHPVIIPGPVRDIDIIDHLMAPEYGWDPGMDHLYPVDSELEGALSDHFRVAGIGQDSFKKAPVVLGEAHLFPVMSRDPFQLDLRRRRLIEAEQHVAVLLQKRAGVLHDGLGPGAADHLLAVDKCVGGAAVSSVGNKICKFSHDVLRSYLLCSNSQSRAPSTP